ncbi:HDOD domain-containing protein [Noviherbaspirillum sedimenti]|uniref:HDOD domain-containing protein n=1 Tax=Noviherbaspirillum sedimenti TaxID=2320865 RepID=A0A3A3FY23_9BURK|nr:HDOD domain-containing protein [Noviherbaspirillum sedimenti]RJG01047.1 HDOD domain-containing protein [Noviherbaspirillum sedimenti]
MSKLVLADIVKGIRDLPSLPIIVVELLNSFEQSDISIGAMAYKVSQDQALSAKTLRLANSSFYGLQRKVTTIQQAITVLGFDSVRTLITAAGVIGNFSEEQHPSFDFTNFWRHAIGTALCAKELARALNLNQDYAFISGLLHDIGVLVLVTRFPEQYSKVMSYRDRHDCDRIEAERAVLGLDHTVVGRALAEYWKFPLVIQKSIANHHAPENQDLNDIPSVIHVANAIVYALDLDGADTALVPVIDERVWNSLNIGAAAMRSVFRETESKFEDACQILLQ